MSDDVRVQAKKPKSKRKRKSVNTELRKEDTLEWVSSNYTACPNVCLPRCTLYQHYLDHCRRTEQQPMGAAAFGKLIRERFPEIKIRRLGTRGQSRYHYYGIGVKPSSIYYDQVYCGKNITRFSGQKIKRIESEAPKLPTTAGTSQWKWNLVPGVQDMNRAVVADVRRLDDFLFMYRAHCCSLLDAIAMGNFESVRKNILHFWDCRLQDTFEPYLHVEFVCDLIVVWDDYLCAALQELLMPTEIQELPESYEQQINYLVSQLPNWLTTVMPESLLRRTKIEVFQQWTKVLKRQLSFTKIAQSCRSVLSNASHVQTILEDLSKLDITEIFEEAFTCLLNGKTTSELGIAELFSLLKKHASVEDLTEWMDMALHNVSTDVVASGTKQLRSDVFRDFMLSWMLLFSSIMRHLTLSRASSFGHVHMVRVMVEEYMLLAFETAVCHEARNRRRDKVLESAKEPEALRSRMESSLAALSFEH